MRTLTGRTPQREQQLQERMMLRLSRRMVRSFQIELNKATKELAESYDNIMEQTQAAQRHRERLARILIRDYTTAFENFGARIIDAAQKNAGLRLELKVDATPRFNEQQIQWIQQFVGLRVTQISNTTQEQVLSIIREVQKQAVIDGASEAETARRIRAAIEQEGGALSRLRSRIIARTETASAANAASQIAAESLDIPMKKEWVASQGERTRTRDAHRDANGQVVELDGYFTVDGEQLLHPSDPNGSAANVINCRCVAVHVVEN